MGSKEMLKKKFSDNYKKYYQVELFKEKGFTRQICKKCHKSFWSISPRGSCPTQPCQNYEFLGKKFAKRFDYIECWKAIEKFFKKNGHASIQPYPLVCRWIPGLYYTVASVVAFQRSVGGKTVFELPENPLVIPQPCLRFNDIANVGVTGRHLTNFIMVGQHSIPEKGNKKSYWKDRCIELDFDLLKNVFKIDEEKIIFVEDVWTGPSAFGYSLEYYIGGLELGNAVFTEFEGTPEKYTPMQQKLIDMGAGLERFAWLSQSTPTCYDAIFGPLMKKMERSIDYDKDFFKRYAILAGSLNLDDVEDIKNARSSIAKELGTNVSELIEKTKLIEALYAIADHTKTILYAVTDGLLPSNVGGGYNLRIVLRRALGFADELGIDIDINDIMKLHAKYLKRLNPKFREHLSEVQEIVDVERKRFNETKERSKRLIVSIIEKGKQIEAKSLIELYESHGITPEVIERIAKEKNIIINLPEVYTKITEKHMKEKIEEGKLDVSVFKPTELLFYKNQNLTKFTAHVLEIIDGKYVILDRTAFYGRAGGQEPDHGQINGCHVYDVEKIGSVIVHSVENATFKKNDAVSCEVDPIRRMQLTSHHTATHVINAAARKVLGNHVWQHSAFKDIDKARIDITHYETLNDGDLEKIENIANKIVKKNLKVIKSFIPRQIAEKRYGFGIYQGGAAPEKDLRIVQIRDGIVDVEACSGTHLDHTKDAGEIIIIRSERVQDGIVRIEFVSGLAASKYKKFQKDIINLSCKILGTPEKQLLNSSKNLFERWKFLHKELENLKEKKAKVMSEILETKFVNNVLIEKINNFDLEELQNISKIISDKDRIILLFGLKDKIYVFGYSGNKNVNIGNVVKEVCEKLGGKGGGSDSLAKGVGYKKDIVDNVIKSMEDRLL